MDDTTDSQVRHAWPELERIAQPARDRRRLPPEVRSAIIAQLCAAAPLSVKELSALLDRSEAYIGDAIRPLVNDGRLTFLYPDQPRHPKQRYTGSSATTVRPVTPVPPAPSAAPAAPVAPMLPSASTPKPTFKYPPGWTGLTAPSRDAARAPIPPRVVIPPREPIAPRPVSAFQPPPAAPVTPADPTPPALPVTPADPTPPVEPVAAPVDAVADAVPEDRFTVRTPVQNAIEHGERRSHARANKPEEPAAPATRPFPNQWTNAVIVIIVGIALARMQTSLWPLFAALAALALALSHMLANSAQYHRFQSLRENDTRRRMFFVFLKGGVALIEIAIVYFVAGALNGAS